MDKNDDNKLFIYCAAFDSINCTSGSGLVFQYGNTLVEYRICVVKPLISHYSSSSIFTTKWGPYQGDYKYILKDTSISEISDEGPAIYEEGAESTVKNCNFTKALLYRTDYRFAYEMRHSFNNNNSIISFSTFENLTCCRYIVSHSSFVGLLHHLVFNNNIYFIMMDFDNGLIDASDETYLTIKDCIIINNLYNFIFDTCYGGEIVVLNCNTDTSISSESFDLKIGHIETYNCYSIYKASIYLTYLDIISKIVTKNDNTIIHSKISMLYNFKTQYVTIISWIDDNIVEQEESKIYIQEDSNLLEFNHKIRNSQPIGKHTLHCKIIDSYEFESNEVNDTFVLRADLKLDIDELQKLNYVKNSNDKIKIKGNGTANFENYNITIYLYIDSALIKAITPESQYLITSKEEQTFIFSCEIQIPKTLNIGQHYLTAYVNSSDRSKFQQIIKSFSYDKNFPILLVDFPLKTEYRHNIDSILDVSLEFYDSDCEGDITFFSCFDTYFSSFTSKETLIKQCREIDKNNIIDCNPHRIEDININISNQFSSKISEGSHNITIIGLDETNKPSFPSTFQFLYKDNDPILKLNRKPQNKIDKTQQKFIPIEVNITNIDGGSIISFYYTVNSSESKFLSNYSIKSSSPEDIIIHLQLDSKFTPGCYRINIIAMNEMKRLSQQQSFSIEIIKPSIVVKDLMKVYKKHNIYFMFFDILLCPLN
ncbi:hypothetical protein TVAG_350230 [Trichomonas vaginalis G3]|uniref:Uncharacterized protein n=1 Tax=Trichomonas vaginalis (strain ATCC PRA-98 / G3) TaxID=412133 RepID=A2F3K4_TRIV3|nr:hypothetical protein TVAGG3_0194130 [Trichomonas vaginalis G3]EAY00527.1 hypothetical protein TVAG_350230 [Trichomonas vaginalis G3]KAI5550182.1 hypothetical protein TVAGG3_0194130 [Trichomonas vaginalis G3]|eukprot:XP_001313456.1 hypothetical protein [Trichomonas vaginalis G3]